MDLAITLSLGTIAFCVVLGVYIFIVVRKKLG